MALRYSQLAIKRGAPPRRPARTVHHAVDAAADDWDAVRAHKQNHTER